MALLTLAATIARRAFGAIVPADGRPRFAAWMAVGVLASAAGLIAAASDTAQRIEWALYDRLVRTVTSSPTPPPDIVIVAIDEPSFREIGLPWPWPRRLHAALVQALVRAGARTIVFDILFDAASVDAADDELFAGAIRRGGNVVLAKDRVEVTDVRYGLSQWAEPTEVLRVAAVAVGAASLPRDPDGAVRRASAWVSSSPGLALAAAQRVPGFTSSVVDTPRLLAYRGPSRRGVTTVSYVQALEAEQSLPPALFRDKTVLVGRSLQAAPEPGSDAFITPADMRMPGVEIHATLLDGLLRNRWVADPFGPLPSLLALVAGLCAAAAVLGRFASPLVGVGASLAVGPTLLAVAYASLALATTRIPVVAPALATIVTGGVVTAWRASLGARQRRLIRRAFEHYVSPAIVGQLLKDPARLALGGEEYELSVLFADLEGFTSFAERMAPTEVRARLGACLDVMVASVIAHEGTVDKLLGDGLVALFGCPIRSASHPEQACRAALAMQHGFAEIGASWRAEGLTLPRLRVGINSGRSVAGNFGTATLFQFTAVGDVVNTASRLEGASKIYGTRILVGETTARAVASRLTLREVDRVRVKGRGQAMRLFELMGDDTAQPRVRDIVAQHGRALTAFYERQWDLAIETCDAVLALAPDDGPTRVLRSRAVAFRATPPPEPWDGVFEFSSK